LRDIAARDMILFTSSGKRTQVLNKRPTKKDKDVL
jgi:hypothetical protein